MHTEALTWHQFCTCAKIILSGAGYFRGYFLTREACNTCSPLDTRISLILIIQFHENYIKINCAEGK